MQIAVAFTGDPNRVTELVRANPNKPAMWVGNVLTFRSLQAGEMLHLPASWHRHGVAASPTGGQHWGDLPMGQGLFTTPMAGGSQVFGLAGNSQLGQQQGDAMIVAAAYAENAASGWSSSFPRGGDAGDVQDLVTPNDNMAGISGTVYVQFKDPPNAQVWKFNKQTQYMQAGHVDQGKLVPLAQLSGGTPAPAAKPIAAAPGTSPWLIVGVGAGALVLGGLAAYFVTRKPKTAHEIAKEEEARQFYMERAAQQFYF